MVEPRTLREQVTACALSAVLLLGAMVCQSSPVAAQAKPISDQEVSAIAADAYLYLYPLVIMDLTRRQMTNVPAGKEPPFGPANTFNNMTEYPPANLRVVVRPNFDTLYSSRVAGPHQGACHSLRARHPGALLPAAYDGHVDGRIRFTWLAHDGNGSAAFPCRTGRLAA